jgi:hypothetical protein
MEDQLWKALYPLIQEEHNRRSRRKRVQFSDAAILIVAFWAVLHDRPVRWACRARHWHGGNRPGALPSPATMSRRLRTLSVQLLLEQIMGRLLAVAAVEGFCLCRRIDSKPLPVGGFSKDRDARWGHATGGKYRGYKLFCCWGRAPTVPETWSLAADERFGPGRRHRVDRPPGPAARRGRRRLPGGRRGARHQPVARPRRRARLAVDRAPQAAGDGRTWDTAPTRARACGASSCSNPRPCPCAGRRHAWVRNCTDRVAGSNATTGRWAVSAAAFSRSPVGSVARTASRCGWSPS